MNGDIVVNGIAASCHSKHAPFGIESFIEAIAPIFSIQPVRLLTERTAPTIYQILFFPIRFIFTIFPNYVADVTSLFDGNAFDTTFLTIVSEMWNKAKF